MKALYTKVQVGFSQYKTKNGHLNEVEEQDEAFKPFNYVPYHCMGYTQSNGRNA